MFGAEIFNLEKKNQQKLNVFFFTLQKLPVMQYIHYFVYFMLHIGDDLDAVKSKQKKLEGSKILSIYLTKITEIVDI